MLLLATKVWEQRQLKEVADIVGGGTPSTDFLEYWNGNINWFTPNEINSQIYFSESKRKISNLGLKKSSAKLLPANRSILFTSRATIGEMGILTQDATTNQGFQSLVLHNEVIPYFIFSMKSALKKQAIKKASGSTFLEISKREVEKLKIIIPSEKEQKKVSMLFKSIDNLITLYDRKKELLKKFQQGFSDILFKKNSKECVSLGDCFYFNKGKNIGNKDLINNGKYYAIVYGELYTTYNYVISKVSSKTSVKGFEGRKNDLLFPSSSTVPFGTATCSALKVDNIELGNDIIIARPKDTNKLDSAFISYQINSKRKILYPIISGTTITHMYSKDLSKIKIWLPSIVTQKYISNILQRIDRLNLLVDKKINILKAIKKELLNTMFI